MHTAKRTDPITKIVLHTNEGPEGVDSANQLKKYLQNNGPNGGGYHVIVDMTNTVKVVADNVVVYGNGGVNSHSLDLCFIGYARQSTYDWADAYSKGELELAAQQVATWCDLYTIPPAHLSPPNVADLNVKGVCGHADVSAAGFKNSAGHYDPGPNFPYTAFLARVGAIIEGRHINWAALRKLARWEKTLSAKDGALHLGDKGPNVRILNDLLQARHYLQHTSDNYGLPTQHAVALYKAHNKLRNRDGKVAGGALAHALLTLP